MIDTYSGTWSTKHACLEMLARFIFIGCEKDAACYQHALLLLVKLYAKQV